MNLIKLPSVKYLNECFRHELETGLLFWKKRPLSHFDNVKGQRVFNSMRVGKIVGSLESRGYRQCFILGRLVMVHRVIWKMFYRAEPPAVIDHVDRNKQNNKIANLRSADHSSNQINTIISRATHGAIGLTFKDGKWVARIQKGFQREYLGAFENKNDALAARKSAEKRLYGGFSL